MTRKGLFVFVGIALAAAAILVAAHLMLPVRQTWTVNRILHYVWEGVVAAAAAGGCVWLMWPRPKTGRRDEQREQARRRLIVLVGTIMAAVLLVVFAEIHRETASHRRLSGRAVEDLAAIAKAIDAYAADHNGDRPESAVDLVPKYLEASRLYYAYRFGPEPAEPPADPAAENAEKPTYDLVKQAPPPPGTGKRVEARLTAYLRAGYAWAPLTAVLDKDGRARIAGEDEVRPFEKKAEEDQD